jgi:hypothetical protein
MIQQLDLPRWRLTQRGFQPLLDGLDLAGRIITADALSRHRDNASYAEVVVMPRWRAVPLVLAVTALVRSA